jgi:hypothetical protein
MYLLCFQFFPSYYLLILGTPPLSMFSIAFVESRRGRGQPCLQTALSILLNIEREGGREGERGRERGRESAIANLLLLGSGRLIHPRELIHLLGVTLYYKDRKY